MRYLACQIGYQLNWLWKSNSSGCDGPIIIFACNIVELNCRYADTETRLKPECSWHEKDDRETWIPPAAGNMANTRSSHGVDLYQYKGNWHKSKVLKTGPQIKSYGGQLVAALIGSCKYVWQAADEGTGYWYLKLASTFKQDVMAATGYVSGILRLRWANVRLSSLKTKSFIALTNDKAGNTYSSLCNYKSVRFMICFPQPCPALTLKYSSAKNFN